MTLTIKTIGLKYIFQHFSISFTGIDLFWLVMIRFDLSWLILTCSDSFWFVLTRFDLFHLILFWFDLLLLVLACFDLLWYVLTRSDMFWLILSSSNVLPWAFWCLLTHFFPIHLKSILLCSLFSIKCILVLFITLTC